MKPSEILSKAADLIEPNGCWAQGAYALDAAGKQVGSSVDRACCFCASGAIAHASGYPLGDDAAEEAEEIAWDMLRRVIGRGYIEEWNDEAGRTQAEVVAALRQAASLAREWEEAQ
jgi:hypothetical protein